LYRVITRDTYFSNAALSNPRAPFDQPFHLLLNVAVGGNFPGNPDGSSVFPQTMEVDYVRVYQRQPRPFNGVAAGIPGVVEMENYDEGYPGVVYVDSDATNNGGAYRPNEDVDIEPTVGGGFNVGWIRFGESIEYTVEVTRGGPYTVSARVASQSTGGSFILEVDDALASPIVSVPSTGGFQTWTQVQFPVTLTPGSHLLRFVNTSGPTQEFNIDRLTFVSDVPPCAADVNGDGAATGADFSAWVAAFNARSPLADQNGDGAVTASDFSAWVANFNVGC
jgi:hypothetical protein